MCRECKTFTFQKQKLLLVIMPSILLRRDSGTNFVETSGKHQLFMFLSHCSKLTFFQLIKLFAVFDCFCKLLYFVCLFGAVFVVERFCKCLLLFLLLKPYLSLQFELGMICFLVVVIIFLLLLVLLR